MQRNARNAALAGVVALGVAGLAGPAVAGAAVNEPPAAPHSIISFPVRDFVSTAGWHIGERVVVTVIRNGVTIGTSDTIVAQDDGDPLTPVASSGIVDVNHPGAGCWANVTPDIVPGDIIRATSLDTSVQDQTHTANVTTDVAVQTAPDTVQVHGTAQDAAGNPLPVAAVESRLVANKGLFIVNNGKRVLRAGGAGKDGTLVFDAPGSINYTATFTGLEPADVSRALGAEARAIWLGQVPATLAELTIFENPQIAGPAAPCTAPLATTGIGAVTPTGVNIANSSAPVTVSGPADANTTSVVVSVPGFSITVPAGGGSWTADIPQASIPQGTTTVTATFAGPAPPPAQTRTITKDTVAPLAPGANPGSGTYATSQSVTISGEPGSTIHYTNDGTTPTASSPTASGQIPVTSSQTLKAIAVDGAGNPGPVGTFAYTITPPAAPLATGGGVVTRPAAIAIDTTTTPGTTATGDATATGAILGFSRPALSLRALLVPARVKLFKAQHQGIRLTMRIASGTDVVKISVYRRDGAKLRLLSVNYRVPSAGNVFHVTQSQPFLRRLLKKGDYEVQVTPGYSKSELGKTTKASFKVV